MNRDAPQSNRIKGSGVLVKDGQFEKAMRKFKKKVQESGKLEEVRARMEYVKPTIQRTVAKNKARRRWLKQVEADEIGGRRPPREGTNKRLY